MNNFEYLTKIQNKGILMEILNHSIDNLICKKDDTSTMQISWKYGFQNPEDFLATCHYLANIVRHKMNSDACDNDVERGTLNLIPDIKELLQVVLDKRRNEIIHFMLKFKNSMDLPLVESFDWQTTLVKSKFSLQSDRLLTIVIFRTRLKGKKELKQIFFQMDIKMLKTFIEIIKQTLNTT